MRRRINYGTGAEKPTAPLVLQEQPAPYSAGGIVKSHIPGPVGSTHRLLSPGKIIERIRHGLPISELDALQQSLDVPLETLALKLGISKATLHRRKLQGKLEPEESDRLVRFARLMGKAVETLESEEAARRWLSTPQIALGGEIPLDYAETEVGAREVEDLLGRIEFGVYS